MRAVRNSWLTMLKNSLLVWSIFSRLALASRCASRASPSLSEVSRTAVTSSTITSTCSGLPLESGIDVAVSCSQSQLPAAVAARTWTLLPSVMPARNGALRCLDAAWSYARIRSGHALMRIVSSSCSSMCSSAGLASRSSPPLLMRAIPIGDRS